jgi:hypothetical protein
VPPNQITLSVFDHDLTIQTDSKMMLDLWRKAYSHLLISPSSLRTKTPYSVVISTGLEAPDNKSRINLNDENLLVANESCLQGEYLHALVFNALFTQIKSHYIFHGAALSFDGQGIIICADSGFGKTTLTLQLVQQGFKFLSDEIAALGCQDGLLYPFPRGLHIRQNTLNLLDIPAPTGKTSRWYRKFLLDIEDIFPGMIGEPVKLSHVFVMKNTHQPGLDRSTSHEIRALLSHTTPDFLAQLQKHGEVTGMHLIDREGFPCLVIQTSNKMKAITTLEDLCSKQGIVLLDLIKRENATPDFSSTIKCERLTRSQAGLELVRHFLGGHRTALLAGESCQDSTRLLFEITSLLCNAECYQITIGPLPGMVEAISNLVCDQKPDQSYQKSLSNLKSNSIAVIP